MNTGAAIVFCKAWPPTSGARQMGASGRSELSQIRTKREMKQLSIGSRVTLRTDDANEILAGLYPPNVHCWGTAHPCKWVTRPESWGMLHIPGNTVLLICDPRHLGAAHPVSKRLRLCVPQPSLALMR